MGISDVIYEGIKARKHAVEYYRGDTPDHIINDAVRSAANRLGVRLTFKIGRGGGYVFVYFTYLPAAQPAAKNNSTPTKPTSNSSNLSFKDRVAAAIERYQKAARRVNSFVDDSDFPYVKPPHREIPWNYSSQKWEVNNENDLKNLKVAAELNEDYLAAIEERQDSSSFARLKTLLIQELDKLKKLVPLAKEIKARGIPNERTFVLFIAENYLNGGTFKKTINSIVYIIKDLKTGYYGYKVPNWQEVSYSSIPASMIEKYKLNRPGNLKPGQVYIYKRYKYTYNSGDATVTINCDYSGIPNRINNLSLSSYNWGKLFLSYYSDLVRLNKWLEEFTAHPFNKTAEGVAKWIGEFEPQSYKKEYSNTSVMKFERYEYCRFVRNK